MIDLLMGLNDILYIPKPFTDHIFSYKTGLVTPENSEGRIFPIAIVINQAMSILILLSPNNLRSQAV